MRAATYDGDTPREEREWVRTHANLILTNPDMLHHAMLPGHARWAQFLRGLRYVVIDECHGYRGVFGSHVAQVLRRLRRVCAKYGASPVFVLASATVSDPSVSAERLTGVPMTAVTDDGSPRGSLAFALVEPPLQDRFAGENGAPVRRSATAETADLLADLVIARGAHHRVRPLASRRRGHRPEHQAAARRGRRRRWSGGSRPTAAATCPRSGGRSNAPCRAVGCWGWRPPRRSSWASTSPGSTPWSSPASPAPSRRCGSRPAVPGAPARAPSRCWSPATTRSTPTSCTTPRPCSAGRSRRPSSTRPTPTCWARTCARPPPSCRLTDDDLAFFGPAMREVLDDLVERGLLRRRPTGWYWTRRERATALADLRGTGGAPVRVVEEVTGRLLGTVDNAMSHSSVHRGAVYVHQGESYVVGALDLDDCVALVGARRPRLQHLGPRRHRHHHRRDAADAAGRRRRPCTSARST